MLELSPTIRRPLISELPKNDNILWRFKECENVAFVEGYEVYNTSTQNSPYAFYAVININNSRLWDLFKALVGILPEKVSCIYNIYEEEATLSDYADKNLIVEKLEDFKIELTQDCNLEFGLMYQSNDTIEEIFIAEAKYIKVWGNDEIGLRTLLNDFGLFEVPNLRLIDEFPKIVTPLKYYNENVKEPYIIIEALDLFFKNN